MEPRQRPALLGNPRGQPDFSGPMIVMIGVKKPGEPGKQPNSALDPPASIPSIANWNSRTARLELLASS